MCQYVLKEVWLALNPAHMIWFILISIVSQHQFQTETELGEQWWWCYSVIIIYWVNKTALFLLFGHQCYQFPKVVFVTANGISSFDWLM